MFKFSSYHFLWVPNLTVELKKLLVSIALDKKASMTLTIDQIEKK